MLGKIKKKCVELPWNLIFCDEADQCIVWQITVVFLEKLMEKFSNGGEKQQWRLESTRNKSEKGEHSS